MNRIAILMLCLAPAALPQERTMTCDPQESSWDSHAHFCEIRETTLAAGTLDVDSGTNGGISVKGADRSDILLRSKVQTQADDEAGARQTAARIHVESAGGHIRAAGPARASDRVCCDRASQRPPPAR